MRSRVYSPMELISVVLVACFRIIYVDILCQWCNCSNWLLVLCPLFFYFLVGEWECGNFANDGIKWSPFTHFPFNSSVKLGILLFIYIHLRFVLYFSRLRRWDFSYFCSNQDKVVHEWSVLVDICHSLQLFSASQNFFSYQYIFLSFLD